MPVQKNCSLTLVSKSFNVLNLIFLYTLLWQLWNTSTKTVMVLLKHFAKRKVLMLR